MRKLQSTKLSQLQNLLLTGSWIGEYLWRQTNRRQLLTCIAEILSSDMSHVRGNNKANGVTLNSNIIMVGTSPLLQAISGAFCFKGP